MGKKLIAGRDQLHISKFNMKSLVFDKNGDRIYPSMAMIAPSGSGKSWIIRDIVYYMRDVPGAAIICPTNVVNHFYDTFIPPTYIYREYNSAILEQIFARQIKIGEKNEIRKKKKKKKVDPRMIFIMDDCMASAKGKNGWAKGHIFKEIMLQGRHYALPFMLAMQYCIGIEPETRSQFHFVFLLSESNIDNKKKLYKNYAGFFPTYNDFNQVFTEITNDYGCMVINNRLKTNDISKKVFWYKAKERPKFKIGCKQYSKKHHKYYDKDYKKRENQYKLKPRNMGFCVVKK